MPTKAEAAASMKASTAKRYVVTDYDCSKCDAKPGEYCEPTEDDFCPEWHPYILHYARVEKMREAAHNDRLKAKELSNA